MRLAEPPMVAAKHMDKQKPFLNKNDTNKGKQKVGEGSVSHI